MPEYISLKDLVIEAADDLACHEAITLSANSTNSNGTIECTGLKDKTIDDLKFRHQFFAEDGNLDNWRMSVSTTISSDGLINLTRAFGSGQADLNDAFHVFKVLDPDDWKLAAQNGLRDKWMPSRFYVPLSDDVDEYNLTVAAPWLRAAEHIMRLRIRDESDGRVQEAEFPVSYIENHEGEIIMQIPKIYASQGKGIVVLARRYYDKITGWDDQIRMVNDRLIRAAVKHEALKLIFSSLGAQARGYFGQQMLLTERELVEQEAKHQSSVVKRDWMTEEPRSTGDSYAKSGWRW